jgi:multidrug efflux pump subunit AcrB
VSKSASQDHGPSDFLSGIVRAFVDSNLSIILIIAASLVGLAALWFTPREEDPQIVVPLADIFVNAPGYDSKQVEQLVSTPLERMLSQIDGVEYVYSMSRDDQAIITVRFYVGQDRERSLVKLFKKLNENQDSIPSAVRDWILKPVEIDDVPIVTLTLQGAGDDSFQLRRIGEELIERLATIRNVNRAYIVGGESRVVQVEVSPDRLQAYQLTLSDVQRAIRAANDVSPGDQIARSDMQIQLRTSAGLRYPGELSDLVVGVFQGMPVYLKDIATVIDAAPEPRTYVRHGWGAASEFPQHEGTPGTYLGSHHQEPGSNQDGPVELRSKPAVTIAISKQKGSNAVSVSNRVIEQAEALRQSVLPDDVNLIITRNAGLTANEKVNELIEALGIAILIVILLLTIGMGWREAFIVAIAVPVVFGLTLFVNLIFGFTINRVTLFALILALGLLVDDPIVDVENIARHFHEKKRASRRIVLEAVAEIRPPLISATLAVIVSFLPMFFITGMMGPYMSPMALNVPVAMFMSMVVAFTITPWLSYHVLKHGFEHSDESSIEASSVASGGASDPVSGHAAYDPQAVSQTLLYRIFKPIMAPLLKNRFRALVFLGIIGVLTFAAMGLGALRMVPLKMLPFDNKNEFLVLLDMDEGTTLERTSAVLQKIEDRIAQEPEVIDYTTYVGCPSPIDFNGLVRHYYLRGGTHQGEIRVNLVGKKNRSHQSHAITLRLRDELTELTEQAGGKLRLVELPPGPPVLASIVAEVYGQSETTYEDLLASAKAVKKRLEQEPGVVEVDDMSEAPMVRLTFVPDQEKAALAGISVSDIAQAVRTASVGETSGLLRVPAERRPLEIVVRLPQELRQDPLELSQIAVRGNNGSLVRLTEIGNWQQDNVGQTIYHKNLQRVAYVMAETAGRPPADCIVDVLADQETHPREDGAGSFVADATARKVSSRTFLSNGSGIAWGLQEGLTTRFSGEGEWQITLDVFRDLGLAFGAAMVLIYIILVAQTGSFLVPIIVMLAIPLTVLGVMPGFYLLNQMAATNVGGYPDPVYFTATAMIGMIALSGIVTRDSIILVDFMEQAVRNGRPLFDAILESRVVRLRPILLTAGAAMLSAIPITLDPIFSGLGWSLIFGLVASTIFTLFVIPVTYWLFYAQRGLKQ